MPTITVEVPADVADALSYQARALLLGRRAYIRAVLAAVAEQAKAGSDARRGAPPPCPATGDEN